MLGCDLGLAWVVELQYSSPLFTFFTFAKKGKQQHSDYDYFHPHPLPLPLPLPLPFKGSPLRLQQSSRCGELPPIADALNRTCGSPLFQGPCCIVCPESLAFALWRLWVCLDPASLCQYITFPPGRACKA